jgi:serine/threonine-protein kinase
MNCPVCSAPVSATSRFCPSCGKTLDLDASPTILGSSEEASPETSSVSSPAPPRVPQHTPTPTPSTGRDGRLLPGTILAERYRVVALAGRGGMGEVYRAEDIRLEQEVALKFLPAALAQDAAALARFHREVRVARQVSHPNVCRVFDIGDSGGIPFLTMEYVDGEDLAALLRRIGRFPADRGVEIARQVCAGLAAAHEHGVIHCDLKPSNVMLDGRGRVRITDFGLAGIAGDLRDANRGGGTPAYMAPEQLAGGHANVKTDLYALGLVLYEIFTGKRAFEAASLPELIRLRESSSPTSPTSLVRDLDPLVERVILRCLDKDPARRPASALQVAAALPGGDPLAAALAAGETPSPEMVAAAGETEGLKPAIAAAMFGGFLLLLLGSFFLMARFQTPANVALNDPPEVLQVKAQELTRRFGYADAPADFASGFFYSSELTDYVLHHDSSAGRWQKIRGGIPSVGGYWYRQSPRNMLPEGMFGDGFAGNVITGDDPPPDISGMVSVELDSQGRLVSFEAVPPQHDVSAAGAAPAADWSSLFAAAGLDPSQFHSVTPQWSPRNFADTRAAWEGNPPGRQDLSLRVEAASFGGKPVSFALVWPWTLPSRMEEAKRAQRFSIASAIDFTLFLAIIIGGLFIARYNLKLGRGDPRGASRLALAVVVLHLAGWAVEAHHLLARDEIALLFKAISLALFEGALAWVVYVALEPFVRRRWPHILISWNRLLAGQFRDPLVGRDVLVGLIFGATIGLMGALDYALPGWLGKPSPTPGYSSIIYLNGLRLGVGDLLAMLPGEFMQALFLFFLFFLLRLVLRKEWLAGLGFLVIFSVMNGLRGDYPAIQMILTAVTCLALLLTLTRFGLAALTAGLFSATVLENTPLTVHLDAWYGGPTWICLVLLLALGFYAFRISLGGRKLFSESAFEA